MVPALDLCWLLASNGNEWTAGNEWTIFAARSSQAAVSKLLLS